jgi:transposase
VYRLCGADLRDAPEVGVERRQVFDLPPMMVRVSEHQLIARRCACGTTTCGTAPQGVSAPAQYGLRITAIVLYLYVGVRREVACCRVEVRCLDRWVVAAA